MNLYDRTGKIVGEQFSVSKKETEKRILVAAESPKEARAGPPANFAKSAKKPYFMLERKYFGNLWKN